MDLIIKSNYIHWEKVKNEWQPYEKIYFDPNKGKKIKDRSILYGLANTGDGTNILTELFGVKDIFDNPKPIELGEKFIKNNVGDEEIVLDFFGGSASTAHAIFEQNQKDGLNRKFILVQLPEETKEKSVARLNGFNTISALAKERIKKTIRKIEKTKKGNKNLLTGEENENLNLGFKVFKLTSSNFKIWRGNEITEENLEQQLNVFTNPVREGSEKENMLYELIIKAGYLLTDKVEVKSNYYSINDGELIIALEEMNQKLLDKIISTKPNKVITLDKLFTGKDQLKTNTVLQMRDAEIDFKTI